MSDGSTPPLSLDDLRGDLDTLEASIAGLHDAVSRTALASYSIPDDADLRFQADLALANLRDANGRLEQLRAAADLAERHKQEAAEQVRLAERQVARDKLIRERDRLQHLADKEAEKFDLADDAVTEAEFALRELAALIADALRLTGDRPDVPAIQSARAALPPLERQLQHWTVTLEVEQEKRANASAHHLEYQDQVDAIDARLDAGLLTDGDLADHKAALAAESTRLAVAEQARCEAATLAKIEAESTRQIRAAYDADPVEVEPTRVLNGVAGNGWRVDRGLVVAVPRRDLDRLEAERRKYLDAEASARAASAAEAEARRIRDEERAADYLAQFTKMQQTAAEWARSSGQRNAEQAA